MSNGKQVDERIYPELQEMFDAARADGLHLFVSEGYRTREEQQLLLDEKTEAYEMEGHSKSEAEKLAKQWVAVPGFSEHQLGIAVDINADHAGIPGLPKIAGSMDLSSATRRTRPRSRERSMSRGIIGMWEKKPPGRLFPRECAWRNMWKCWSRKWGTRSEVFSIENSVLRIIFWKMKGKVQDKLSKLQKCYGTEIKSFCSIF